MWIAVAAVAVVVVVVIAVFVLLMGSNSGGGSGAVVGTPAAFSQTMPLAVAADSSESGAPWTIVAASGLGIPGGVVGANLAIVDGSGCTFTPTSGSPSTITFPGTPSTAAAGTLSTWLFFAKNASENVLLLTEVSDGTALPLVTATGSSCVATFVALSVVNASAVIDSPVVAASMNMGGGSGFLENHTGASQLFVLFGGSPTDGGSPIWSVSYTTCPFTANSGSGSGIIADYYATSGAVLSAPTSQTGVTC